MSSQQVIYRTDGTAVDNTPAESQALAVPTPMRLMELAIEKGVDADTMGKLLDLHLRWEAEQQRKAYIEAMAIFRANPPEIKKTKKVEYENKDRSLTTYYHAELDKAVEIISEALAKVEIRPSWRTSDVAGKITVTCVLTHRAGHSEDVATLSGPPDVTGGKNNVQAIGSTTTYLQRYTLLAGTGLAAEGQDDDGKTEGMDRQGIEDYCTAMRDAATIGSKETEGTLQYIFGECFQKAKAINDKQAMGTFIQVYEQRKRELR